MSLTVASIMSPSARRISSSMTAKEAGDLMALHQIRHLPVEDDGDIVGVLTESAVKLALALSTKCFGGKESTGDAASTPKAGEICSVDPLIVPISISVADLALEMAKFKHDCALVADENDNFVGIVTLTDICRTLNLVLTEKP